MRRTSRRTDVTHPGTTYVGRYVTAAEDCVRKAGSGREWSDKPPVVASCAIIRRCEELFMIALQQGMLERHCSLGIRQQLDHLGPVAVGAEIEITARCIRGRGRYSSWHIIVRDADEIVGQGRMDFVVVHRSRYEARRLNPTRAALALDSPSRPSALPALYIEPTSDRRAPDKSANGSRPVGPTVPRGGVGAVGEYQSVRSGQH
jgi:predicted thioesterase